MGVAGGNGDAEGAGKGGSEASFPTVDVGAGIQEEGMWGLGEVGTDAELVAHCTGEDKKSGGVASEGCDVSLEGDGCWVFIEDVIEEGGVFYGGEHGAGWSRDDVTCVN